MVLPSERESVMSLFKKAIKKSKSATKAVKSKATNWVVGSDAQKGKVANSVKELVRLSAEAKAIDAKMSLHKQLVSNYAFDQFVSDFASVGVKPETPMKVVNEDGDQVTYVVQDRSGQYNLKDEQIEMVGQILGEDVADGLVYTEVTIGFNKEIMALPGVSEVIEKHLEKAVQAMLDADILDEDEADELLTVNEKRAFKPKTIDRAAELVGKDKSRLAALVKAFGSSCCRYVKV